MRTIALIQGSESWGEHRKLHRNASDTPAVMGVSKYKTRSQLLKERATGIMPEHDEHTIKRFNDGHKWEALARPIVEDLIGETLSPVTGVNGLYSASFDGITFEENEWFEHKSLNDELRQILSTPGVTGADLPMEYQLQMEHQAMVCGGERCLFAASKWDEEDNLLEFLYCWYMPNPALRKKIEAAWDQFERDVAAYVPEAEVLEATPDVVLQLPALSIQASGEISIRSNLDVFGRKLGEFVKNLNLEPETDLDFANADEACKVLQKAQDALEAAEANALAQASSVDELRRTVAALRDTARNTRLMLEKLVTKRKADIKLAVISKGKEAFLSYLAELESGLSDHYVIRLQDGVRMPDFAAAAKSKRTMTSLKSAVADELASAKAAAHVVADGVSVRLKLMDQLLLSAPHGAAIVTSDLQSIIFKSDEDFELQIRARIDRFTQAAAAAAERKLPEPAHLSTAAAATGNVPTRKNAPPSAQMIVHAVANTFQVDAATAAEWIAGIERSYLSQLMEQKPF